MARLLLVLLTLLFSLSGPAIGKNSDVGHFSLLATKGAPGKSLLAGEGAVGTYDDLIAAGTKGDNITGQTRGQRRMALS